MPKKLTQDEFIERSQIIHDNKYDYSLVEYVNNITKVKIMMCYILFIYSLLVLLSIVKKKFLVLKKLKFFI